MYSLDERQPLCLCGANFQVCNPCSGLCLVAHIRFPDISLFPDFHGWLNV